MRLRLAILPGKQNHKLQNQMRPDKTRTFDKAQTRIAGRVARFPESVFACIY